MEQATTDGGTAADKEARTQRLSRGWMERRRCVRPFFRPLGVRLQQKSGFPSERAFYIGRPHNTKLHEGSNELCRKCSRRRRSCACLLDVAHGSHVSNCDSPPPSSTSLNGCACARSALPEIAPPIHRGSVEYAALFSPPTFPLPAVHFVQRSEGQAPGRSFPD